MRPPAVNPGDSFVQSCRSVGHPSQQKFPVIRCLISRLAVNSIIAGAVEPSQAENQLRLSYCQGGRLSIFFSGNLFEIFACKAVEI